MRFQPRDGEVVWEANEGELLLIDLSVGVYFSVREATAQLISDLLHGHDTSEILDRWTARFLDPPRDIVAGHLESLLALLQASDLLRPRDAAPSEPGSELSLQSQEFPPVESYDDMKEIFEMDPIHDGDVERGWPVHN